MTKHLCVLAGVLALGCGGDAFTHQPDTNTLNTASDAGEFTTWNTAGTSSTPHTINHQGGNAAKPSSGSAGEPSTNDPEQVGGNGGAAEPDPVGAAGSHTEPTGPIGNVCDVAPGSKLYDCSANEVCKQDFCGDLNKPGVKLAPSGTERADYTVVVDPEGTVEPQWCHEATTYKYNLAAPGTVCVRATAQRGSGITFADDTCGTYVPDCVVLQGNQVVLSASAPVATAWLRLEIAGLVDDTHTQHACPFTCGGAQ